MPGPFVGDNATLHYWRPSVARKRHRCMCPGCGVWIRKTEPYTRIDYSEASFADGDIRDSLRDNYHQFAEASRENGRYKAHFWCYWLTWMLWSPEAPIFARLPNLPLIAWRMGGLTVNYDWKEPEVADRTQLNKWPKGSKPPRGGHKISDSMVVSVQSWARGPRPQDPVKFNRRWPLKHWFWSAKYHKRSDKFLAPAMETGAWIDQFAREEIKAAWHNGRNLEVT